MLCLVYDMVFILWIPGFLTQVASRIIDLTLRSANITYELYYSKIRLLCVQDRIYITKISCIYGGGRNAVYSENQAIPTDIVCGRNRALVASKARGAHRDPFHLKDRDCCDPVLFHFELRITPHVTTND